MEVGNYKKLTTSRGFTYSYYHGAPTPESLAELNPEDPPLPALLFLHGFPTSSRLWKHQIRYFEERGFLVIVPDLLGFGDSSKPTEVDAYRPSLVCNDIVEIVDHEKLKEIIAIGHDIGSRIVSRLWNYHSERFKAFAFVSVPYWAPRPQSKMDVTLKMTKKMCGYELCGHMLLYAEDDADKLIVQKLDAFMNVMFPEDPIVWVNHVAPIGALKSYLERGVKAKIAPYIQAEDVAAWSNTFSCDGISPALCWYKALVSGLDAEDDKAIPLEKYHVNKPVFFAAAKHNYISRSLLGIATINHNCSKPTIREFHDGHWLMLSSPAEFNFALLSWILDYV